MYIKKNRPNIHFKGNLTSSKKKIIADTLGLGGGGANYFMHISLIPLSCGESVFGLSIPEVLVLSLVVGLISGNVDIPLI